MGSEIYGFIEFTRSNFGPFEMFAGDLSLCRNSNVFSALTGGVNSGSNIYSPRGIPDRLSYNGFEKIFLPIIDAPNVPDAFYRKYLSPEDVKNRKIESDRHPSAQSPNDLGYATPSSSYNHSWLRTDEIKDAFKKACLADDDITLDYRAVLSAMEAIGQSDWIIETRFVFWFEH